MRVSSGTSARIIAMPSDSPVAQPFHDVLGRLVAEIFACPSISSDRRHHFAVARRLEKPDVLGVGVEDVHVVEIDVQVAEPPLQLPGDRDEAGDRDRQRRSTRKKALSRLGNRFAFMIRFGGSPYAVHTPQIVVTAVHTITA